LRNKCFPASATSTAQWAELAGAARLALSAADIAQLNAASAEAGATA
jgi:aryl-alcohol dehydrogenase-like predicted oxidoreductase